LKRALGAPGATTAARAAPSATLPRIFVVFCNFLSCHGILQKLIARFPDLQGTSQFPPVQVEEIVYTKPFCRA
jgi:hypothetical protein